MGSNSINVTEEIWKDIPGYEGRYQVSSLGRVKSLERKVRSVCHYTGEDFYRTVPEKILRPGSARTGHVSVVLGHGVPGSLVHQLVLLAFVGPRPDGCDVCHINGDPTDNRLENLRYDTRKENILDVYRLPGGRWRKLSVEDVTDIRQRLQRGEKGSDIAKEYSMSQSAISAIKCGRAYGWLDEDFIRGY